MEKIIIGVINLLLVAAAPLLDGIARRIRARVQSRKGPPITQTYYDLAKMMVKEDHTGENNFIFTAAPIIGFASVMLAALFIPLGGIAPFGFAGDVLALIYILTIFPLCLCLGGMSSGSPYAYVGSNREVMLLMVVEPILAIALITGAIKTHSLLFSNIVAWYTAHPATMSMLICGIAFFLAMQSEMGKLPFDIAEAEQELMEGPLIEYSGRKLALFKWAMYGKQMVFLIIFVETFMPWLRTGFLPIDVLITIVEVVLVAILIEGIALVFPRLKITQAIPYFSAVVVFALTGLTLAVMGL